VNPSEQRILDSVGAYYTGKLRMHGATPLGVDWNSPAAQTVRFDQIARVLPANGQFSVNDYGCGYGALLEYIRPAHPEMDYRGYDISQAMIDEARKLNLADTRASFTSQASDLRPEDYSVASGIFSVRLETAVEKWEEYATSTIRRMAELSRKGFSFNMLTAYSDPQFMRETLYYADPHYWFDHCRLSYSRNVALLHDYGLYEFTILVRY
jgi:SAM-dependent methyltransferase